MQNQSFEPPKYILLSIDKGLGSKLEKLGEEAVCAQARITAQYEFTIKKLVELKIKFYIWVLLIYLFIFIKESEAGSSPIWVLSFFCGFSDFCHPGFFISSCFSFLLQGKLFNSCKALESNCKLFYRRLKVIQCAVRKWNQTPHSAFLLLLSVRADNYRKNSIRMNLKSKLKIL